MRRLALASEPPSQTTNQAEADHLAYLMQLTNTCMLVLQVYVDVKSAPTHMRVGCLQLILLAPWKGLGQHSLENESPAACAELLSSSSREQKIVFSLREAREKPDSTTESKN